VVLVFLIVKLTSRGVKGAQRPVRQYELTHARSDEAWSIPLQS